MSAHNDAKELAETTENELRLLRQDLGLSAASSFFEKTKSQKTRMVLSYGKGSSARIHPYEEIPKDEDSGHQSFTQSRRQP